VRIRVLDIERPLARKGSRDDLGAAAPRTQGAETVVHDARREASVLAGQVEPFRYKDKGATTRGRPVDRGAEAAPTERAGSEASSTDSPALARDEVVPALQRAYTYSDWLDDRLEVLARKLL
jgi:hypothetical protein